MITSLAVHAVHVDGRYNNEVEPTEQVMYITRRYSRGHWPDLNPVMLMLMVEHQAGIVVLMQPLSGHSSDTTEFSQVVRARLAQW